MRRSTLIVVGYAVFGALFLINAITGEGFRSTTAINVEQRTITWGVLGVIWLLVSAYALLQPEQFNTTKQDAIEQETIEKEWGMKRKTETKTDTDPEIGYAFMFSVVFVMLLVLSAGVLLNLFLTVI